MAQLTTTNSSGTQATTQSPQSAGAASTAAANSSSLQPGTATRVLDSGANDGVPLSTTPLTTVNFNRAANIQATTAPVVPDRHVNPAFFSITVILVLVAVALFWWISRSEKNTTF